MVLFATTQPAGGKLPLKSCDRTVTGVLPTGQRFGITVTVAVALAVDWPPVAL